MHSLLEVKSSGLSWGKVIFPTDSLPLDHLDDDQAATILQFICQELSSYDNYSIFMPHEVAQATIGSIDQNDYNDTEFHEIKETMYDLVIALADILFKVVKQGANYYLKYSDGSHTVIAYQIHPKELY